MGAAQYSKSGSINTIDLLGNAYLIGPVGDTQMAIAASTKAALNGVGVDWGPTREGVAGEADSREHPLLDLAVLK